MAVVIRLRSRDGMFRCSVPAPTHDISTLWKLASDSLKRSPDSFIMKKGDGKALVLSGINLLQAGLKHGDIVTVEYPPPSTINSNPSDFSSSSTSFSTSSSFSSTLPNMDSVDSYLETQDGLIKRHRDPKFCRHGDKGMCEYCSPLEPYDTSYMQANKIKHLSFHSYIRKLLGRSSINNKKPQSFSAPIIHPLSPISYRIPTHCTGGHAPWPAGICSKCQPSTISLQLQPYRMVDHVEVESPEVIDRFLSFWRSTGYQRFTFLFGKYTPYDKVPLGIKVVVSALYEPPQSNALDGLQLTYLPGTEPSTPAMKEAQLEFDQVMEVAHQCGLNLVGMAFTDLEDDQSGTGKVSYKRHEHSFFLSGLEVQLAAYMQKKYPCITPYSSTGEFGSRFVTVVVSGNQEGGIELEAYMVSETAVAMLDAQLIEPSTSPSLFLVTEAPYVPDILYTEKNEYGTQVSKKASPSFPCDYLLVNLTHGFPSQPTPSFTNTYPIEHRFHELQSLTTLHTFLSSSSPQPLPDFHFLLHLHQLQLLSSEEFSELCQRWSTFDFSKFNVYFQSNLPLSNVSQSSSTLSSSSSSTQEVDMNQHEFWGCVHCTYHNPITSTDCEMCGLPK